MIISEPTTLAFAQALGRQLGMEVRASDELLRDFRAPRSTGPFLFLESRTSVRDALILNFLCFTENPFFVFLSFQHGGHPESYVRALRSKTLVFPTEFLLLNGEVWDRRGARHRITTRLWWELDVLLSRVDIPEDDPRPLGERIRIVQVPKDEILAFIPNRPFLVVGVSGIVKNERSEICGVKGSGKDTTVDLVSSKCRTWKTIKCPLARPLKELVCDLYDVDPVDQEQKKSEPLAGTLTYRHVLEKMGSELIRTTYGTTVWKRLVQDRIQKELQSPFHKLGLFSEPTPEQYRAAIGVDPPYQKPIIFFIPDLRFEDELEFFQAAYPDQFVSVYVTRYLEGAQRPEVFHVSDAGLDPARFDHQIYASTLKELESKVFDVFYTVF